MRHKTFCRSKFEKNEQQNFRAKGDPTKTNPSPRPMPSGIGNRPAALAPAGFFLWRMPCVIAASGTQDIRHSDISVDIPAASSFPNLSGGNCYSTLPLTGSASYPARNVARTAARMARNTLKNMAKKIHHWSIMMINAFLHLAGLIVYAASVMVFTTAIFCWGM